MTESAYRTQVEAALLASAVATAATETAQTTEYQPTQAEIDALAGVLREELALGGYARVGDFTREEILAGALVQADEAASQALDALLARALKAAHEASDSGAEGS